MADFTNITLHKPLPVNQAKFYLSGAWEVVPNLLDESNLLFDAVTGRDGHGGDRILLLKPKLTLYYNRYDTTWRQTILIAATAAKRFPVKIQLGNTTNVENSGTQWISYVNEPDLLTFQFNLATANRFLKSALVFTGVHGPGNDVFGDYDPV